MTWQHFFVERAILERHGLEKSQNALARGRQLCTQLSIIEGSLAELLRFWCCQLHKLRKSRRIASFLVLSSSKVEEVSQTSFVFKLADRQIDRQRQLQLHLHYTTLITLQHTTTTYTNTTTLLCTTLRNCNNNYNYTTLRYTTLDSATLYHTTVHNTTLRYTTLHYTKYTTPQLQLQLQLHYTDYTTLQLQLHYTTTTTTTNYNYNCTTPHYMQQLW